MRWIFAFLLMITAAQAETWRKFESARFGFSMEVPSGFLEEGVPPENDEGARFVSPDGTAELLVWGARLSDGLAADARAREAVEEEKGWRITYSPARKGKWYVYSGVKGDRIVYLKAVTACRGELALYFRIEYPRPEKEQYDTMVTRLSRSMKAGPSKRCTES